MAITTVVLVCGCCGGSPCEAGIRAVDLCTRRKAPDHSASLVDPCLTSHRSWRHSSVCPFSVSLLRAILFGGEGGHNGDLRCSVIAAIPIRFSLVQKSQRTLIYPRSGSISFEAAARLARIEADDGSAPDEPSRECKRSHWGAWCPRVACARPVGVAVGHHARVADPPSTRAAAHTLDDVRQWRPHPRGSVHSAALSRLVTSRWLPSSDCVSQSTCGRNSNAALNNPPSNCKEYQSFTLSSRSYDLYSRLPGDRSGSPTRRNPVSGLHCNTADLRCKPKTSRAT